MPVEIRMPRLMDSMTQGAVVAWRKGVGEAVREGEALAEIEADKTTVDLESPAAGILARILVEADGEKVDVGRVLAVIDEGDGAGGGPPGPARTAAAEPARTPAHAPSGEGGDAGPPASPLARSMALQAGLDLAGLRGTGPRGRIVREDVERALGRAAKAGPPSAPRPVDPTGQDTPHRDIPHSTVRRLIADRLGESKRTIPHFYLEADCELDAVLREREELGARPGTDWRPSLNDFAARAAAVALREVPELNASWREAAIRRFDRVDLAVAVATDAGLVAPVVRDADRKGLRELSDEIRDLADRARAGRLRPEELSGGTFTVSNLGMYGIGRIFPIINPPQAGILGLGAAAERPVARGGRLAVATTMTCTLAADHRAVDGAAASRFLAAFRGFLERPVTMLV
ncbi:Dihydrolipoyllysine-residue acetyltransferase component of pyruvate dehydrogenase complex [Aquisphaera giovannonii]|uniref:Dihydrolipoamide acetyltransferase component of pyruvate dehydrogenase complex n=1 Tax=Aquisphaera giovannonii TaxID=406548 RepID=A0A5B9VUS3_9BACT|nr:dihydrolipoamide acetyltransferase family protein [Aquisphaera giovannonii]QEH31834.1 Dihydrolipoyllysine-residue acetyltransferase component of pyruvate dehydrogenase complex [Aquisphaera giovannonii]